MADDFTWLLEIASPRAPLIAYKHLCYKASRAFAFKATALLHYLVASSLDLDERKKFQNVLHDISMSRAHPDPGLYLLVTEWIRAVSTPVKFAHAIEKTMEYISDMPDTRLHSRLRLSNTYWFNSLGSEWLWGTPQTGSLLNLAISNYNREIEQSGSSDEEFVVLCRPQIEPPAALLHGASLVKQSSLILWSGMQKIVSVICPFANSDAIGFTLQSVPGVIFVNTELDEDEVWYAERLVHESAHLKLDLINECTSLLAKSTLPVYNSPWRDDKRPIEGVLHGIYVHWHVVQLLSNLINVVENSDELELQRQIELQRISEATQTMNASGLLTHPGHLLIEQIVTNLNLPA